MDPIFDWPESSSIDYELTAEPEHYREMEGLILMNGKPSDFQDVHDGEAVYIGRENSHYDLNESDLANPYPVDDHGRQDSVLKYASWLIEQMDQDRFIREQVFSLYGRPVACWCFPELCHGHVLNLFLVYRLHMGIADHQRIEEMIKSTISGWVSREIQRGNINPAEYKA